MRRIIKLQNKEIDLANALPFKIKVWRTLKDAYGVSPSNIQKKMEEDEFLASSVIWEVAKTVDPAVTLDDIESSLSFQDIVGLLSSDNEEGIDRPT